MNKTLIAAVAAGMLMGAVGKTAVDAVAGAPAAKSAPVTGPCCGPNAKDQGPCGCSSGTCLPQEC